MDNDRVLASTAGAGEVRQQAFNLRRKFSFRLDKTIDACASMPLGSVEFRDCASGDLEQSLAHGRLNVNKNAKVFAMAQTCVFYVTKLGSKETTTCLR